MPLLQLFEYRRGHSRFIVHELDAAQDKFAHHLYLVDIKAEKGFYGKTRIYTLANDGIVKYKRFIVKRPRREKRFAEAIRQVKRELAFLAAAYPEDEAQFSLTIYPGNNYRLIMPHWGDDVFTIVNRMLRQNPPESPEFQLSLSHVFYNMLLATQKMHERGIIHRDLRQENFVRDIDGVVRIIDGATYAEEGEKTTLNNSKAFKLATQHYAPPEFQQTATMNINGVEKQLYVPEPAAHPSQDVYMLCRSFLRKNRVENGIELLSASSELYQLAQQGLSEEPSERPTIEALLKAAINDMINLGVDAAYFRVAKNRKPRRE